MLKLKYTQIEYIGSLLCSYHNLTGTGFSFDVNLTPYLHLQITSFLYFHHMLLKLAQVAQILTIAPEPLVGPAFVLSPPSAL